MSGLHCLSVERDIGAPIFTLANSLVRLTYFHTNRLLTGHYKTETEIRWRKDDNRIKKQTDIDRHGPKPSLNSSQPPNPPPFSLPTTFKARNKLKLTFYIFLPQKAVNAYHSLFDNKINCLILYIFVMYNVYQNTSTMLTVSFWLLCDIYKTESCR